MSIPSREFNRCLFGTGMLLSAFGLNLCSTQANPAGGTVSQGSASFNTSGSQMTIRTSDRALINWQSFNIGVGQTTTFIQPSSSSVVWNRINDSNPSQILGNLNANGYLVLQNSAGFYVGGQAVINVHGLVMTTSPVTPDLFSGGAWDFSAPPPMASIINYGQINVGGGGSAFLIAHDIENHGTISAPDGDIGLYAGKDVLISQRPDGRGLSAHVTLPEGSVDNSGNLIADGGTIALHAQVVNQGGLIQANSVKEVNGKIELVASDAINLGAGSVISAKGGDAGKSSGGSVTIKSSGSFSDQATSKIDISGGAHKGNGGELEISAANLGSILSQIDGHAANGSQGGKLLIDPTDLVLDSTFVSSLTPILNAGLYRIDLQADHNITLSTLWNLADPGSAALLKLTAGNSIFFNNNSGIRAGQNWSVSLAAGPQNLAAAAATGVGGIYLNGNSYIDALNGSITLWAANEVIVNSGAIRTRQGGDISVETLIGDVNAGNNFNGYTFGVAAAPYYSVNAANLGGISTAAGGNVTIKAGRDVISFLPTESDPQHSDFDGGSGAFGPQAGDVSITAGRNIRGHFVLANGNGSVHAGGDIGNAATGGGFALSLVKGAWDVQADGTIYVQDVRNPNGIFNDSSRRNYAGKHYFDYDPAASVSFHAGDSVEISGFDAPHTFASLGSEPIALLFPSILKVTTDSGDFKLDQSVILFPSAQADLKVSTGRNFFGLVGTDGSMPALEMSDSAGRHWEGSSSFGTTDHASTPMQVNDINPVEITVGGNLESVKLYVTKKATIKVAGDMVNTSFTGENLHAGDETWIDVHGAIRNSPLYTFVDLNSAIASANPLRPDAWDSLFVLALNPDNLAGLSSLDLRNLRLGETQADALQDYLLFPSNSSTHDRYGANPGFQYDSASKKLGFLGNMAAALAAGQLTAHQLNLLEGGQFTVLVADAHGNPIVDSNGHVQTKTYTFSASSKIASLYTKSLNAVVATAGSDPISGLQLGGPGTFKIDAGSLDLGNSLGIISWGVGGGVAGSGSGTAGIGGAARDFSSLSSVTPSGAEIDLNVAGDISIFTSTIASVFGGKVDVTAGGKIDLSPSGLSFAPLKYGFSCYGIYTSGHSDVSVTADGDININNSRIGAFNGGKVTVRSDNGNINAGNGANDSLYVLSVFKDSNTGAWTTGQIGDFSSRDAYLKNPTPHGSGILAYGAVEKYWTDNTSGLPGDIVVETPHGDIISTLGGIKQIALDGNVIGTPSVTLHAGTEASGGLPAAPGNVFLGQGGVVGGKLLVIAEGDVEGLFIGDSAEIHAAKNFSGHVFAKTTVKVTAVGEITGDLVGIKGVDASGGDGVKANILAPTVSVGGLQQDSTLGTAATASVSSQSAANQTSSETKEQVASNNVQDDDDKKKKKGNLPGLTRRVGRVTVILPKAM